MSRDWTGHVIVCGLRGEGLRTIEQLHLAGVQVIVVDDRPTARLLRTVQGWGVLHLERDSRLAETLTEAGLAGAIALIGVEADDLHTLETALLARELRPDLRVVVQMRNPAVGRAVAESGVAVLDVARLSAPSLVEACLQTGSHELVISGVQFMAVTVQASGRGSMRALYGDLAPVAVRPAGVGGGGGVGVGQEVIVCPGRDVRVKPGDSVTVLGTVPQLREARVLPPEKVPEVLVGARYGGVRSLEDDDTDDAGPKRLGLLGWSRNLVRSLITAADRRIWTVLVLLAVLVVTSTAVLHFGYHEDGGRGMSVLDGLYFTIETIGTVGYGDFSFRDQDTVLRFYAIGLMIVGAIMATAFFALLTNVLVSQQIEESLGRLRVTRLSGHVVVVGLGSIGIRVVELLVRQGAAVVVVEPNPNNRYLAQARALGVPVVSGDATQAEVLDSVHLTHAKAVAVLTSDDLVNIETGLAVRDLLGRTSEIPLVLRLFDNRLARTLQGGFGFNSVRSTAALAAPWFVGAALGLDVIGTFYVAETPMLVASLRIAAGGGLDGLAMVDLAARTRVVALSRLAEPVVEAELAEPLAKSMAATSASGSASTWEAVAGGVVAGEGVAGELEYPPRRDTRFSAGDVAYLVGTYEELLQVLRNNQTRA